MSVAKSGQTARAFWPMAGRRPTPFCCMPDIWGHRYFCTGCGDICRCCGTFSVHPLCVVYPAIRIGFAGGLVDPIARGTPDGIPVDGG